MRKIIILTAALLLGVGSIFAQSAWEVKAEWTFTQDSDCHTQLTSNHGYRIDLLIYDDANSDNVSKDEYNLESWTELSTIFPPSKTKVQAYCGDTHPYTPSFSVYITVRIYHLSTHAVICTENGSSSGWSCSDFSTGGLVIVDDILFD